MRDGAALSGSPRTLNELNDEGEQSMVGGAAASSAAECPYVDDDQKSTVMDHAASMVGLRNPPRLGLSAPDGGVEPSMVGPLQLQG